MRGIHHVTIETKKIKYEFSIRRNITVIEGDSATGKTTLASLIAENARYGETTGVSFQSDVLCITFDGSDMWEERIRSYDNSIIIIDEGNDFIFTKDFARTIQETTNYYVLITRKPLVYLPYSISEIYGIRISGKYHYPEKIYNEFYPLYERENKCMSGEQKKILITEDSGTGYQFFENTLDGIKCLSAEGNARVYRKVLEYSSEGDVTIIADGAAFGAFIGDIVTYAKYAGLSMYFPESFEWMILKSGVVNISNLKDILQNPEKYIDSKDYFSWERYFTHLLKKVTESDKIKAYNKDQLKKYYLEGKNRDMILDVIPKEIRDELL